MNIKLVIAKALRRILRPAAIRDSEVDKTAKVCSGSHINYCSMGRYSYIGNDCYAFKAKIGNFCSIGDNCKIGAPSHPMSWVSTSPVFYTGRNILGKNFSSKIYEDDISTTIENDVWVGEGVLIKSGVHIGNGAVVGMGSVVTHDIPAYEIWAGNPARFIRKRFNDDMIEKLSKVKWWDWNDKKLKNQAKYFNNIEAFLGENDK